MWRRKKMTPCSSAAAAVSKDRRAGAWTAQPLLGCYHRSERRHDGGVSDVLSIDRLQRYPLFSELSLYCLKSVSLGGMLLVSHPTFKCFGISEVHLRRNISKDLNFGGKMSDCWEDIDDMSPRCRPEVRRHVFMKTTCCMLRHTFQRHIVRLVLVMMPGRVAARWSLQPAINTIGSECLSSLSVLCQLAFMSSVHQ